VGATRSTHDLPALVRPKAADSDVRALLEETGCRWTNLQRRQPRGENRPIARIWLVPIPWPATSLELVIAEPDLQDVGADHRSGW
jgi:hypothetical protein